LEDNQLPANFTNTVHFSLVAALYDHFPRGRQLSAFFGLT